MEDKKSNKKGISLAILAALCYSLSSPLSKILLNYLAPTLMAGFLYLGAGVCMIIIFLVKKIFQIPSDNSKFQRKDYIYIFLMVILDIAAPILLMYGLKYSSAANVSLLNNFEIVMTAIIAFVVFKEKMSLRVILGIITITISCLVLSFENDESLNFSIGSLFVLLAAFCWGIENNCTKKISNSDPIVIVLIKGIFSGTGSLIIGFAIGETITSSWTIFAAIGIGIVAYGLSILFYIYAQRYIGAARTSAYYAINPFVASILSLILFLQIPTFQYVIALAIMIIGAILTSSDKPLFKRKNNIENR